MKKTACEIQESFDALNLTLPQKKEFLFRLRDQELFLSNRDFLIPPIIFHYITLYAEYPSVKYLKLKCVSNKKTYKLKEISELTEKMYHREKRADVKSYSKTGRLMGNN